MMDIVVAYYLTTRLDRQVIKTRAHRCKQIVEPIIEPIVEQIVEPIVEPIVKPIHTTTCYLCGQYIYFCVCNYM